jgi:hypothetical protein
VTQQLERALALTERVHEAIQAGDWLRASELEQERRAELEALVREMQAARGDSDAARAAVGAAIETALGEIEQRTLHLVGEVHHHRRRVLREAAIVKAGRDAAGAYETP